MLCLNDLKRITGKGVVGPPEMLWHSKSPGTDGESLKGVGGGVTSGSDKLASCVGTWALQKLSLLQWQ